MESDAIKSRLDSLFEDINFRFAGDDIDGLPITKANHDKIRSWVQWFESTYPTMEPDAVLESTKDAIDFRVFFLTYPIPGFALLRVTDACYHIDKALCGTSASALERVEKMWNMDQFKYLSSEDHTLWWQAALCELNDSIEDGNSGDLRVILQLQKVVRGAEWLKSLCDELDEDCWIFFRESPADEESVQMGYEAVQASIYGRDTLLSTSAESLNNSFEKAKLQSATRGKMEAGQNSWANIQVRDVANEG
jgi:hypothetical protein